MKANIKLSLSLLTPVKLLALLSNVEAKLKGSAVFPTPPVSVGDLDTLIGELEGAIELATNGSRAAIAARHAKVAEVQDALRREADYVRSVALGDLKLLSQSGFEISKKPAHVGIPGIPERMEARITGKSAQLKLRWRAVHGAHGYQVWMTEQDPAVAASWQAIGYTTRVSHLVDNLQAYKAYWFCVSAIGVQGEGMQSDPALGRAA